jgi:hypothetical protein
METTMSKKSDQRFTPEDFQQRFDAAALAAQREYCDIFEFWHLCRLKACRRAKACGGDAQLCLRRGFAQVADETSERALMRVIAATAADADRPTRLARQMSPQSFAQWPLRGLV